MYKMIENYITTLLNEKCPGFTQKHQNTNELIKQYEPEILSVFDDIANTIIESVEEN